MCWPRLAWGCIGLAAALVIYLAVWWVYSPARVAAAAGAVFLLLWWPF